MHSLFFCPPLTGRVLNGHEVSVKREGRRLLSPIILSAVHNVFYPSEFAYGKSTSPVKGRR